MLQTKLRYSVDSFTSKFSPSLSNAEETFLCRSRSSKPDKIAHFYMLLKTHKGPWQMRPIVLSSGTFIVDLSKWVDYWLQQLMPLVPSYIQDSIELFDDIKLLGKLPNIACLIKIDVISMYTNIETNHSIAIMNAWLNKLHANWHLPEGFPTSAIRKAISLVLKTTHSNLETVVFYNYSELRWELQWPARMPPSTLLTTKYTFCNANMQTPFSSYGTSSMTWFWFGLETLHNSTISWWTSILLANFDGKLKKCKDRKILRPYH